MLFTCQKKMSQQGAGNVFLDKIQEQTKRPRESNERKWDDGNEGGRGGG